MEKPAKKIDDDPEWAMKVSLWAPDVAAPADTPATAPDGSPDQRPTGPAAGAAPQGAADCPYCKGGKCIGACRD
jgi:hypothetical protein